MYVCNVCVYVFVCVAYMYVMYACMYCYFVCMHACMCVYKKYIMYACMYELINICMSLCVERTWLKYIHTYMFCKDCILI